ncbi:hypothetical protein U1Q18_025967, partial [Sarracenia purpurea var. burkii]
KSGLGSHPTDPYALFIEEEWDTDASLVVPGEEAGNEMINDDDSQVEGTELDQVRAQLASCHDSKKKKIYIGYV